MIGALRINRAVVKLENHNSDLYRFSIKKEPLFIEELLREYPEKIIKFDLDFEKAKDLPFINDTIAYYDEGHLNTFGSRKLGEIYAEEFVNFLKLNNIKY